MSSTSLGTHTLLSSLTRSLDEPIQCDLPAANRYLQTPKHLSRQPISHISARQPRRDKLILAVLHPHVHKQELNIAVRVCRRIPCDVSYININPINIAYSLRAQHLVASPLHHNQVIIRIDQRIIQMPFGAASATPGLISVSYRCSTCSSSARMGAMIAVAV